MSLFTALKEEKKLEITDEVKELLGIKEVFEIDNEKKLDWYLQKQMQCLAEVEAIKQQMKSALSMVGIRQKHLTDLYQAQAEAFAMAEYAKTGNKTMVRPYGTLRLRDTKDSWVKADEPEFQHWLANMSDEDSDYFKRTAKTYTCNLDTAKAYAEAQRTTNGDMQACEGLKFKEGGLQLSISYPGDKE